MDSSAAQIRAANPTTNPIFRAMPGRGERRSRSRAEDERRGPSIEQMESDREAFTWSAGRERERSWSSDLECRGDSKQRRDPFGEPSRGHTKVDPPPRDDSVNPNGDPELYFNWNVSFAKVSPFGVEKKVRNLSSSSSRLFFLLLPLFPEPCTHHDVQVIVINDRLPGPLLNVTTNNVVSVNVFNNLDDPFLLTWYIGTTWITRSLLHFVFFSFALCSFQQDVDMLLEQDMRDAVDQGHKMLLVETEGSYTLKQYYHSLDIHVGQSYSVLVTADQPPSTSYYIVASSRFLELDLLGVGAFVYIVLLVLNMPLFYLPLPDHHRWDLKVGAARPNPQGSYRYGHINITRTIVLQNDEVMIGDRTRYAINGVSFVYPDTPLKLADYFRIAGVLTAGEVPDEPSGRKPTLGTPVVDASYKSFVEIVFQNNESWIQSWHMDGYNFVVVGSQELERRQLGQELYMRVKWDEAANNTVPNPRDEMPFPPGLLLCGKAAARSGTP
ncbi:hypothetical protein GW17_00014035 [Ensete ventricosum]|nr:hypothetical protein GW17_00014035 [Ensete ventricosum]